MYVHFWSTVQQPLGKKEGMEAFIKSNKISLERLPTKARLYFKIRALSPAVTDKIFQDPASLTPSYSRLFVKTMNELRHRRQSL